MTDAEKMITEFLKVENDLSDEEFENEKEKIVKSLKVKKGDFSGLCGIVESPSNGSIDFEKRLNVYRSEAAYLYQQIRNV